MLTVFFSELKGKFLLTCTLSLILSLQSCCAQHNSKRLCSCILVPRQIKIPIYKEPNSSIINYLLNDTVEENYYLIKILKQKDAFSYVKAIKTRKDSTYVKGWLETKYLGIYSNIYSGRLILYSSPTTKSHVSSEILNPQYRPFKVSRCTKDGWLLVEYSDDFNDKKSGWMSPEDQCSNPYSTCN